jgi:hypothetical protein
VTASRRHDVLVALAALVPLAWLLVRERAIAGAAGFPLDDSWIHLHFARNLAEGLGFAYNPGQPMSGSTAPLWTLLLAAGALVAGATVLMTKTLGVTAAIVAALVLRRVVLGFGVEPSAALVAAVTFSWTGALAWGALSGMEVTLAALLVALALLALARDLTWATAVAGALATLARPEALLVVPSLALARPLTLRRAAIFLVTTVAVLLPFVAFSYATVGRPLPATAVAKVEAGWSAGCRVSASPPHSPGSRDRATSVWSGGAGSSRRIRCSPWPCPGSRSRGGDAGEHSAWSRWR